MSTNESMVACPRKSIVSYFWITTFAVFAAQYAADNVIKIINAYGIRGGLSYLGVPFIFYVTLLRFSIGNILHIRQLEKKGLSPYIWLYDFSVIFLESLIFLFLGACTWGNDIRFLKLLLILCFVDVFWIMSMIPHYVKKKRPEPLPWAWGLLNIAGAAYLAATIWCDLPIPLTGPYGHAFFVLWFLSSAIIDIILIDHYKLLKALD